jgi:hypothetical protein
VQQVGRGEGERELNLVFFGSETELEEVFCKQAQSLKPWH